MANLVALALATAVLVAIPGPNAALIVANSVRDGFRSGVITVSGTTLGVAAQLSFVVAGVAAVVELATEAMTWIRWAGVLYLVYLGVRAWNRPARALARVMPAPVAFWRGCMTAALNPKTLLFSAAFLPQFVAGGEGAGGELVIVAAVFLAVLAVGDLLWAAAAGSARRLLACPGRIRNRVEGAFLATAGIGLAAAGCND